MDEETKWTYGQVKEITFFAMLKMAAETGKRPSELVSDALELLITKHAERSQNPSLKLHEAYMKMNARKMAKKLIVQNSEEMSEIITEQILGLCDLAGMTLDQVLDEMNKGK